MRCGHLPAPLAAYPFLSNSRVGNRRIPEEVVAEVVAALGAGTFHGLLDGGVYIAPALYEAGFVSAAHTDADIDQTIAVAAEVFRTLA